MTHDMVILFPDANIPLQYRSLREIDWKAVANAKTVRLVLCSPVLDELDENKYNPRTAGRARTALAEIKQILEDLDGHVREGVVLEVLPDEDEAPTGANRDAAIIQRVKCYSDQHEDEPVAVVSGDYNMSLRCKAKGIECIDPGKKWLRPIEDEKARKLRQLQQENQRLRNLRPALGLLVSLGPDRQPADCLDVPLAQPRPVDIEKRVAEIEKAHPKLPLDNVNFDPISAGDYNAKLDEFVEKYKGYLENLGIHQNAKARTLRLSLWIDNTGTCPADNVEVILNLPDRFLVVIDEKEVADYTDALRKRVDKNMVLLFEGPREPKPPERPKSRVQTQLLDMSSIVKPLQGVRYAYEHLMRPSTGLRRRVANLYQSIEVSENTVELWARTVKHNKARNIGTVLAVFKGWEVVGGFEVPYEIRADNHPDVIADKLVVRPSVMEQKNDS